KRVLESGAGSGILSILAAQAGARAVYAIEKDEAMSQWARRNVQSTACSSIVRVIEKDTRDVTLSDLDGQAVDVVIAEHLSTWQVTEPQISVMNHVNRRLAKASAIRIPECAWNCVELASSRYLFEDLVELRTHYFVFSGIRGPLLLSPTTLCREVDWSLLNEPVIDQSIEVEANRDGVANSVRLTSPLRIYGDIRFRSSDSLMPPVVVPLAEDLAVRAGDVLKVRFRYRCESDWSQLSCVAWRTDSYRTLGCPASPAELAP
nr:50S ribosomal protein L11 methyltransferase [Acidobacteriota bacterium]